jgi:hypothetical protein
MLISLSTNEKEYCNNLSPKEYTINVVKSGDSVVIHMAFGKPHSGQSPYRRARLNMDVVTAKWLATTLSAAADSDKGESAKTFSTGR